MKRILLLVLLLSVVISCGKAEYKHPDLGGLYTRAARRSHDHGNAVIVIPGILGSKLRDSESGQLVWGAFEKSTADPETPEGARLVAIPMKEGVPLKELKDNVYSDGALDKIKISLFGLPIELNAYVNILSTLGAGGYLDESIASNRLNNIDYGNDHFTCFQFAYDWRLDNVENAKRLDDFIESKRAYILEEYKKRGIEKDDVKFDIVAHSMGGLVTRYFLRYGKNDLPEDGSIPEVTWDGAEHVGKVIIIGTPNAGAVGALENLFKGRDFGLLLPKFEPAIIGTMPSLYQQLPRSRHRAILDQNRNEVDILDPEVWIENGWGLADPNQEHVLEWLLPDISDPNERREIAIDHLRKSLKRAKQFQEAIDQPANPPENLKLYLIAGDAILTGSGVTVDSSKEHYKITDYQPGDGTVTRSSALMDEREGGIWTPYLKSPIKWSNVMFLFSDHLGLTKDPSFSDNVLYILLEQPVE
ncbi:MAG: hypothetical protein O6759_00890 [Candidatus Dadabacteria bacterium]|nr:hypothetical protein [Candidatus Dadabacteria bacterium]